ncbi:N-glycosylase/DNA lyase [Alkalithermobacter thermoalcaliphilus JW-YL-7 = DSM 7308]|uniref:DNA-(apurinic or apyrimidinic site) lyase n=1 Tax=Alkalithermobacter thermoalcaliphilus JW-YL-7 = DSM 7308 TaxID=1121328 RepID=A0A150FNG9_CLOPD|nr:DNA-(apurinic or apyrimidinic site) lyase [[Clostridium] paradoxum JW-YL-7 = DSM 7308]SHK90285.1 N-glycosylase/DNA lyase [[Clostridium] paradoxum JW-YL-7 = DSM 7308]
MKIYNDKNKVIIDGLKDFEPKHIFECGQCFRWTKENDDSYTIVAFGKILNVKKEENTIYFNNTNIYDFENIWHNYFDLDRDYSRIKEILRKKDNYLDEAVKFGYGIRILNQDPWETIISFIISANNRIPMIKKAIDNLSTYYGEEIGEFNGKKYYSFPTIEKMNSLSVEEIEKASTGYRATYIKDTSYIVFSKQINIYNLKNVDTNMCKSHLMMFPGVGPKVADCIMLFSMQKYDVFPVDVWVQRVMKEFYLNEDMSLPKIRQYGIEKFKELSGFAQQYLFYYARELGIGTSSRRRS